MQFDFLNRRELVWLFDAIQQNHIVKVWTGASSLHCQCKILSIRVQHFYYISEWNRKYSSYKCELNKGGSNTLCHSLAPLNLSSVKYARSKHILEKRMGKNVRAFIQAICITSVSRCHLYLQQFISEMFDRTNWYRIKSRKRKKQMKKESQKHRL